MVVPGQDAAAIAGQRAGKALQHANAARIGHANPVVKKTARGLLGWFVP
jgi:hypothetical protein